MMKEFHIILAAFAAAVAVAACGKAEPVPAVQDEGTGKVRVVDSYLRFEDGDALMGFLEGVESGVEPAVPEDFVSVRERGRRLAAETRAARSFEMTEEEFKIHRAEQLLVDPALFSVMDTDLTVGVGNRIYRVTDEGTFVFPDLTTFDEIDAYIGGVDLDVLRTLDKGQQMRLSGGVDFIRTYGSVAGSGDLVMKSPSVGSTPASGYGLSGNLHAGYNVTTYAWKANGLWQNILEILLIKDYIRYAELDDTHRFAVHVYNNNFGFVEAAGVKAVVQEKRKFLFATYWVNSKEKYDIESGFNYLYSRHKNFMKGGNFSSFAPAAFTGFKTTSTDVTGTGSVTFLYGKCAEIPYVSGWGKDITFCLPYLSMSGVQVTEKTKDMLMKLYDDPQPKELMGVLRRAASLRGASDGPAFLMVPRPSSGSQFRNDLALAAGARRVSSDGVDIRLLRKGGFSWSGGVPAPIQFSTYEIMALDTFASVRWNGKWTGVRFVFN